MGSANERRRYDITSSLISWTHTQTDSRITIINHHSNAITIHVKDVIFKLILRITILSVSCEIGDYSAFVQVMTWCRQAITWSKIDPDLRRHMVVPVATISWWCHQMETFSALLALVVRGIHRSPVNSPHKSLWLGALMFSLICAWTNGWVNNQDAGDLMCHRAQYDVTVMVPNINSIAMHLFMSSPSSN